jgi:membrane-associated phospholipid phosphatase
MGSMGMSGLGGFAGDGAVFPALVQGLTISMQAVLDHPTTAGGEITAKHQLRPGEGENLGNYAAWVRASLYLTDFMRSFDWQPLDGDVSKGIVLSHGRVAPVACVALARPGIEVFKAQLRFLHGYRDQRGDRASEILTQLGLPADYFGALMGLTATRHRHTLELMTITQVIAAHVTMVAKHHLACRRPDSLDPSVMPMIPTPGHNAYPSAHAAEAFAVATVLNGLVASPKGQAYFPDHKRLQDLLLRQAARIAVNRTVAGMHFPVDSWAGAAIGEVVGQIILAMCGKGGAVRSRSYTAHGDSDFSLGAGRRTRRTTAFRWRKRPRSQSNPAPSSTGSGAR